MKNFQIFYDALKATFEDKGVTFPSALASILEPRVGGMDAQSPVLLPAILYVYLSLTKQLLRSRRQHHH